MTVEKPQGKKKKIETKVAKTVNLGSKSARDFYYFVKKAQCADKLVLQSNINLAARLACELKESDAIDLVVKQVVQLSTRQNRFTEIAIFLTDSIMRHAARCGVDGLLERYQKRLKPHLRNLFKRALRREGPEDAKDKLATRLKDKIVAYWKQKKWFPTELGRVSDIIQSVLGGGEDAPDDDALASPIETKEERSNVAKAKATFAGVVPATPAPSQAKATGASGGPFPWSGKASAPFSASGTPVQSLPLSEAVQMKEELKKLGVPAKAGGIPRTPSAPTAKAPIGIPRTPAQIIGRDVPRSPQNAMNWLAPKTGMPGAPAMTAPTAKPSLPRTPAQMAGAPGIPRTPAQPKGLPRTPAVGLLPRAHAFGLPKTAAIGLPPRKIDAVPRSPVDDSMSPLNAIEPPWKRQRVAYVDSELPKSPAEFPQTPEIPGSPEILNAAPKTPQSPVMLAVPKTPPKSGPTTAKLLSAPVTPPGEALPYTPVSGVTPGPGTPSHSTFPDTPNTSAGPITPNPVSLVPQTPIGNIVPKTPVGQAVPHTPGPGTSMAPKTPSVKAVLGAVPRTPTATAKATLGVVPQTPGATAAAALGGVPQTPAAVAKVASGGVPQTPAAVAKIASGGVPQTPAAVAKVALGGVPETPKSPAVGTPSGFVPQSPPAPVTGKASAVPVTRMIRPPFGTVKGSVPTAPSKGAAPKLGGVKTGQNHPKLSTTSKARPPRP